MRLKADFPAHIFTKASRTELDIFQRYMIRLSILYTECMHDYLAIEYYPEKKLKGFNRALIALSSHLKGECDAALFANAYRCILMQEQAKKARPYEYVPEALKKLKL